MIFFVFPVSQLELVYDNICVCSCVTEGLDRKTSYFKRQAGKHAPLCQPKTKTSDYLPLIDVSMLIMIIIPREKILIFIQI